MKTAVIYTRVSSKEQVAGTSLDTQLAECMRFAERAGYSIDGVYTDAGLSAKAADNRPELQRALKRCMQNGVKALIVYKVDRLSRNTADGIAIREMLKRAGCEVVSATEGFTADPLGDAMSSILLTFAQLDNAQRAARCRTGMEETALRGGWCHKAPEGFDRTKNADGLPVLVINERGRALQVILQDYAAGRILKSEYYSQCASIGISKRIAEKIPDRDIYAGIIRETLTGGQPVKAAFPGMITPDELLAIRKRATVYTRRPKASVDRMEQIFKGLVKCQCGHALSPYVVKKKFVYWKCPTCNRPNISAKTLYETIRAHIAETDFLPDLLHAAAVYARTQVKAEIEKRRKLRQARRAEGARAEKRLNRLTDLFLDEQIDEETFNRKAAELRTIIATSNSEQIAAEIDINEQITLLEKTAQSLENPTSFIDSLPAAKAHTVLHAIFGEFIFSPEKQLITHLTFSPTSLCALLHAQNPMKSTKSGKPSPAASSSDSVLPSMVDIRSVKSNFEAVVERCREIVAAVG